MSALWSAPRAAAAQAPLRPVEFVWDAPRDGCPDAARVRAQIERALGRAAQVPASRAFSARATVGFDAEADAWQVRLQTTSVAGSGERTLAADSCEELAAAAALVVALAVDQSIAEPAPSAATPAVRPAAPPVARPPLRRSVPLRVALRLFVALDAGTLPAPSPGAGLAAALLIGRRVRVEVAASSWVPQDVAAGPRAPSTGGALYPALVAALRGCAAPLVGRVELAGCLGLDAGLVHGRGYGIAAPATSVLPWLGPAAAAAVAVRLSPRVAVRLTLEGVWLPDPPRFQLAVAETNYAVHGMASVIGRGTLGIEARF
jgi:hypothetical protein